MGMNNSFLYVVTVLIWGSTWLAIEFQLGVVQPEVSVVYRYAIAAALLFAWCLAKGQNLRFNLQAHVWFVLLGFIPYVGGLIVLVFMCLEGTQGPNRFGADPKGVGDAETFA